MDVILHLYDGTVTTITDAVEADDASRKEVKPDDKFLLWEVLRHLNLKDT